MKRICVCVLIFLVLCFHTFKDVETNIWLYYRAYMRDRTKIWDLTFEASLLFAFKLHGINPLTLESLYDLVEAS